MKRGIQAVVLDGTEGSLLQPLIDRTHPPSLLPICNTPLIEFSLLELRKSGLCNVVVVASSACEDVMREYVQKLKDRENWEQLDVWVKKDQEESGEILLRMMQEIGDHSGEVVVVGGNIVGGDGLVRKVLEVSRKRADMLTIVLGERGKEKGNDEKEKAELFALFPKNCEDERLLALVSATDLGEGSVLRIRPSHLQRYPAMVLKSDVFDPEVYVIKKPVIELLEKLPDVSSLRHDLVPTIVRKQFRFERKGEYGDRFTVSAMIADSTEYMRKVRTLEEYLKANLEIAAARARDQKENPKFAQAGERANVSANSVLGDNVIAGSRTSIKKSIIGFNVTLGSNVKLNGCVIMAGTVISDKVNLAKCIVGMDCKIMSNVILKSCQVGHGVTVEAGTEMAGQVVSEAMHSVAHLDDDIFEVVR